MSGLMWGDALRGVGDVSDVGLRTQLEGWVTGLMWDDALRGVDDGSDVG